MMLTMAVAVVAVAVLALFVMDWGVKVGTLPVPPLESSAVVLTGCSSGIGRETAGRLSALGVTVFATVRKQADAEALTDALNSNVIPVMLDVSSEEQMRAAVVTVQEELARRPQLRLTGLVNNAGLLVADEDDLNTASKIERVLQVNTIGTYRMIELFMPLLLPPSGASSRVINVGSYFGSFLAGDVSYSYAASKHALEALSDGLRRRLRSQGIHVALVKPGNIATNMNPKFGESKSDAVAAAIEDALFSAHPRSRYWPGTFGGMPCRMACMVLSALPDRLGDLVWGLIFRKKKT